MAQQTLQTVITLSGRVDNSFGKIGESITNIGSQINALSGKIIKIGQEGVEEFVKYDDAMRNVQALGQYDKKVMDELDAYNRAVAQTSRYTMEQAANAEVMMAQLGLGMDQIKTLTPTVMNLSTAANIGLSDSLNYLYYTLNSLGLPMSQAETLSDQMARTASMSAVSIDTLGQSFQRLGSTAQFFTGGTSEILAILGGISKFGEDMQGTEAGTQLRNFMLTLLAPMNSKGKILKDLKVTQEEWADFESYMEESGIQIDTTRKAMNKLGLTMYDSTGKMKPAIQIIGELSASLSSLSEQERNQILGDLFGKRTTTTAKNLIAMLGTIIGYKNEIDSSSAGYTQYMTNLIEGGLGGALRNMDASVNALKNSVGKAIAPELTKLVGFVTDVTNALNDMDEGRLDILVGAAEGIAAAGPALLIAGGAFRLIGSVMSPIGAAAAGLTALAAAAGALAQLNEINEENFKSTFGEMELDTAALTGYVDSIGAAFTGAYAEIDKYSAALDTAIESYQTASSTLSGNLLTHMITGATLTDEQKKSIEGLGQDMATALNDAIIAKFDANTALTTMIFGGEQETADDELGQRTIGLLTGVREDILGKAKTLGEEFGSALGQAMDDGIITGDEYNAIMRKMEAYNQAMSAMNRAKDKANLDLQLNKAQSVSWDSAAQFLTGVESQYQENMAKAREEYDTGFVELMTAYNYARDNNLTDENGNPLYSDGELADLLAGLNADYQSRIEGYKKANEQIALGTMEGLFGQSDAADAWAFMNRLYNQKGLSFNEDGDIRWDELDLNALMAGVEDTDALEKNLSLFAKSEGRMRDTLGALTDLDGVSDVMQLFDWIPSAQNLIALMGELSDGYDIETARAILSDAERGVGNGVMELMEALGSAEQSGDYSALADIWQNGMTEAGRDTINRMLTGLSSQYDLDAIMRDMGGAELDGNNPFRELIAAYRMLQGGFDAGDYEKGGTPGQADGAPVATEVRSVEIETELPDGYEEGNTYAADWQIALDSTELEPNLKVPVGEQDAMMYIAGFQAYADANPIRIRIQTSSTGGGKFDTKGRTAVEFAEGGRATEASIFGEAGPEWAIPEEHTDRTASLLDEAREASGFTWPELIEKNGGLNAGNAAPTKIVYSPTIIANDATDVEQKLAEDKDRFERWWRERCMRDDVEVYAT